jgi:hypothetical protein
VNDETYLHRVISSEYDHPKYGPTLLGLLTKQGPGFHPVREIEKMYNDPEIPPKLKKRLQKDLTAYGRVVVQDPKPRD